MKMSFFSIMVIIISALLIAGVINAQNNQSRLISSLQSGKYFPHVNILNKDFDFILNLISFFFVIITTTLTNVKIGLFLFYFC